MGAKSALHPRLIGATLGAPAIFALLGLLPTIGGHSLFLMAIFMWISLYQLALVITVVVGLPIHALLLHRNQRAGWHYAGAGLAAALFIGLLMVGGTLCNNTYSNPNIGLPLLIFAISGTLCAFIFWLLRRPDRDASPLPNGGEG